MLAVWLTTTLFISFIITPPGWLSIQRCPTRHGRKIYKISPKQRKLLFCLDVIFRSEQPEERVICLDLFSWKLKCIGCMHLPKYKTNLETG